MPGFGRNAAVGAARRRSRCRSLPAAPARSAGSRTGRWRSPAARTASARSAAGCPGRGEGRVERAAGGERQNPFWRARAKSCRKAPPIAPTAFIWFRSMPRKMSRPKVPT